MEVKVLPPERITTIGLGSPRPVYFPKNVKELLKLLLKGYPIIGGGSNVILSEGKTPLISLKKFSYIRQEGDNLTVGAGTPVSRVLRFQVERKLSILEFLAGIPRATIGGIVAQNAGAFGREVKDVLISVKYLDRQSGELKELKNFSLFSYRSSPFPELGAVVEATFKTTPDTLIKEKIERFVNLRLSKQPPFYLKTAGSTFKNPETAPAGKLLDLCGLRGFRVGGVGFSEKHANFAVNYGGTFNDFSKLIDIAREKVLYHFGISLPLEVKVID
ncbi:MAG: UDP-N-acetylmuramate dehydrogenase [Desulfurobacteriaceae bacterium]